MTLKLGLIGYPSYASRATWITQGPAALAAFPVTNLGNLLSPRKPCVSSQAAAITFSFALPAAVTGINLVTLLHHNLSLAAMVSLQLFSDTARQTKVYDSGAMPAWPTGAMSAYFAAARPIYVPNGLVVGSGNVVIAPANGDPPVSMGAIDVAQAWQLPNLDVGMQRGLTSQASRYTQASGVPANMRQFSPRMFKGTRKVVDFSEAVSIGMDFYSEFGRHKPFVFVRDINDPVVWLREAFLCRNATLPKAVNNGLVASSLDYDLVEYLG